MRKYIVVYNDTHSEGECALYDATGDVVVMNGDYYHDKIESKIDGFFTALQYAQLPFEKTSMLLTPDMNITLWNKCEFYDGRNDY